ncbi:MAG TPA: GNAT family N-acetyltransferase [Gaiellales bacterium]|jgi:CelD/BcsL family acetyltransferase involved in cellulose biosynthesis|nr:GNAT family N-acetyltransferase [Gaiellales bacterium]
MVPLTAALLSVRTLTDISALAQMDTAWDALVEGMPRPSPYLFSAWVIAWLAEAAFASEPHVIVAERAGELVGLAPFVVKSLGRTRVAMFAGAHESALGDIVLAPGEPPATARMLLEALPASGMAALDVFGLPGNSVLAEAAGSRMRLIERVESPVTEMPDGWEEAYNRHTSSNRRNQDRRRERQLGELGSLEASLATTGEAVLRDLPDAFVLHQMRWQGRPDGSTFGSPEGQRFQQIALPQLADEGRFAMLTLRLDGRPIAFHNWFIAGSSIYLHRNAFDASLSRYGPGLVALRRSLSAASDLGARRVEYLGGAEQFKRDLADRFEPLHQGFGLAHGAAGHAYVARAQLAISLRKRLKRSERLHRLYLSGALRPRRHAKSS